MKNNNEIFGLMKLEPKRYSMIFERMVIQYFLIMFNIKQYLPPSYLDSNFFMVIFGIVLQKKSDLKFAINKW